MNRPINKIGIEVEYILRKKGNIVFPSTVGLEYDDFSILGECRSAEGSTREEVIGNFQRAWTNVLLVAKRKGLTVDLSGMATISPDVYAEAVRKPETKKSVPVCENIYGYDILKLSDAVIDKGIVQGHKISSGLHIHFSSVASTEVSHQHVDYVPVKVSPEPLVPLFRKGSESEWKTSVSCNRITYPVIRHIVQKMDTLYQSRYKMTETLKYRVQGFYEVKHDGRFEYRSMPFNTDTLNDMLLIVDHAFSLLEAL